MKKTKKRNKYTKPILCVCCMLMILGVVLSNSVIPCFAIANNVEFSNMVYYGGFPYDVSYYGDGTHYQIGCVNYASENLMGTNDDGISTGRYIGGGVFDAYITNDLCVGYFPQDTLFYEATVPIYSEITENTFDVLPYDVEYMSPVGVSYNATIEDVDTYGLGYSYIKTHYLIPNCLSVADVSASCGYGFDLLVQSASGGVIDGYESENVLGTVYSSNSSDPSPFITVEVGDPFSFDYTSSLYYELYDNADLFTVLTVTVYPNAIFNEYNTRYGLYDDIQNGYSVSGVTLTPRFEVLSTSTYKLQDYVDEVRDEYGDYYADLVDYYDTEFILTDEPRSIGTSFSYPIDYYSKSLENYAKFTGDYTVVQEVVALDTNLVDWLGSTLGGVLDVPLLGENITLGTCLYVCVGLGIAVMILKFFAGG